MHPRLAANGIKLKGELWAMMLDSKHTFDELIDRTSPNPGLAAEIKKNRVYRQLSTAVSGSQEFAAIAKLYELDQEGNFDLLVLDTPPSRNALDFLDAPGRLTSFLDGRGLKLFLRPAGFGLRVLGQSVSPLLGVLSRVAGVELLAEMSTFFQLLGDTTGEFSQRAAQVERMLRASSTAFVLVTSAQDKPMDETIWLCRALAERRLPLVGSVVNRIRRDAFAGVAAEDAATLLEQLVDVSLAQRVIESACDHQVLAQRDEYNIARLASELVGEPLLLIPEFDDNVHDISGLERLRRHLFACEADRVRMFDE
jgi:anion-transporting  ArsA/GET3 family ATPase